MTLLIHAMCDESISIATDTLTRYPGELVSEDRAHRMKLTVLRTQPALIIAGLGHVRFMRRVETASRKWLQATPEVDIDDIMWLWAPRINKLYAEQMKEGYVNVSTVYYYAYSPKHKKCMGVAFTNDNGVYKPIVLEPVLVHPWDDRLGDEGQVVIQKAYTEQVKAPAQLVEFVRELRKTQLEQPDGNITIGGHVHTMIIDKTGVSTNQILFTFTSEEDSKFFKIAACPVEA